MWFLAASCMCRSAPLVRVFIIYKTNPAALITLFLEYSRVVYKGRTRRLRFALWLHFATATAARKLPGSQLNSRREFPVCHVHVRSCFPYRLVASWSNWPVLYWAPYTYRQHFERSYHVFRSNTGGKRAKKQREGKERQTAAYKEKKTDAGASPGNIHNKNKRLQSRGVQCNPLHTHTCRGGLKVSISLC